ncbi:MAG TPA: hypothetical protein VM286_07170 [Candidatus Thermoplasmatota archaeon]|nr:hypothetical protein [Candidatus Thermoplasmatota archaeon]
MKLPQDFFGFTMTPGTILEVGGHIYVEQDQRLRLALQFGVKAPQSATIGEVSQKLTQTVEPIALLEGIRNARELENDIAQSIRDNQITAELARRWIDTDPGVFTGYTATRDILGWDNRKAWEMMFFGEVPVYAPGGGRREKLALWRAMPLEEREQRQKEWKVRKQENYTRYLAFAGIVETTAMGMEMGFNGGDRILASIVEEPKALLWDVQAEPWLSRKMMLFATGPRTLGQEERLKAAIRHAEERGRRAQARQPGDGPDWFQRAT